MADDQNSVSVGCSGVETGAEMVPESELRRMRPPDRPVGSVSTESSTLPSAASNNNNSNNNNNGNGNGNGNGNSNGDYYINGERTAVMRADELASSAGALLNASGVRVEEGRVAADIASQERPLILIDDSNCLPQFRNQLDEEEEGEGDARQSQIHSVLSSDSCTVDDDDDDDIRDQDNQRDNNERKVEEQVEEIDGIKYRIVAAVTKPAARKMAAAGRRPLAAHPGDADQTAMTDQNFVGARMQVNGDDADDNDADDDEVRRDLRQTSAKNTSKGGGSSGGRLLTAVRRKSSAFVTNLLSASQHHSHNSNSKDGANQPRRRQSIYEMTKSPPPETSLEIYLSDRRRSSTVSAKQVQQQLEQQSTFETNYCQRQQYFKDLNQKLINQDKKLLNVVANRGQIHRHSVDIAQLPLHSAQANAALSAATMLATATQNSNDNGSKSGSFKIEESITGGANFGELAISRLKSNETGQQNQFNEQIGQEEGIFTQDNLSSKQIKGDSYAASIDQSCLSGLDNKSTNIGQPLAGRLAATNRRTTNRLLSVEKQRGSISSRSGHKNSEIVIRKFQKLDQMLLSSTPAPDVKIGQRVAYKEYYGNEFGTIRWIGRVPQICPDWTVGVEFDNAIGEGDGSLNGRRYFIAKDCFAKFIPLNNVALVEQHVGRPEPGTMISVMSAAVRPGQMISIQRVSTVHVQHCFLNAPHQIPGADILAVNTRLHCQCPNCGPCAHVIKPPRTQRLARAGKNATHMCQFSTYTCCGMESQEEALCTYTGNKIASLPPPVSSSSVGLPPIGNSWIEGAGYLSNLQAQQSKLMPEEYRYGAAPEDAGRTSTTRRSRSSRRGSERQSGRHKKQINGEQDHTSRHRHHHHHRRHHKNPSQGDERPASALPTPNYANVNSPGWNQEEVVTNSVDIDQSNNMQVNCFSPSNSNNLAIACPEKAKAEEDYHVHRNGSEIANSNNNNNTPRSPRVNYRHSIENRYLFPIDDSINSTLEADLEDLSQARYGRHAHPRLNSSRNIFKSLCSLVSCLNTQSNNSELERHFESTIEYSANNSRDVNKSMPAMYFDNNNKMPPNYTYEAKNAVNDYCSPFYRKLSERTQDIFDQEKSKIQHCDHSIIQHKSSDDCGFSSASQNSINFCSHQTCSPVRSNDEDQRTLQIYKRILARLMSCTTMTNEDFYQLRKIIFASPDSCQHQQHQPTNQSFNANELDKKIADILKKSSYRSKDCEQAQLAYSASCQNTSETSTANMTDSNGIEKNSQNTLNSNHSIANQDNVAVVNKKRNSRRSLLDGFSSPESTTPSSYDSFCGAAEVGLNSNLKEDDRKTSVNSSKSTFDSAINLPKAFELKLTLSINSDNNNSPEVQNFQSEQPDGDVIRAGSGAPQASPLHVSRKVNISS